MTWSLDGVSLVFRFALQHISLVSELYDMSETEFISVISMSIELSQRQWYDTQRPKNKNTRETCHIRMKQKEGDDLHRDLIHPLLVLGDHFSHSRLPVS
jgi:hypothetical protein